MFHTKWSILHIRTSYHHFLFPFLEGGVWPGEFCQSVHEENLHLSYLLGLC